MRALADLVLPSNVVIILLSLGLLTHFSLRTRRASWWLLASSGITGVFFSSGMIAAALMSPLEHEYPAVLEGARYPQARHIVVLTGWAADDPDLPLTGRFGTSTAFRVLMTLELYRDRPDCSVIVSGVPVTARVMAQALVKLGVPVSKLQVEDESLTTADSAANLRSLLNNDAFFLVTSAGHMPRTIATLRKNGLDAIAVPTDHQLPKDWKRAELRPSPASLRVADLAVHEYLGRAWYRMRGAE